MTTDAVGSVIPEIITEFRLSMTAAGSFQYATMAGIAGGALSARIPCGSHRAQAAAIVLGLALYGASSPALCR